MCQFAGRLRGLREVFGGFGKMKMENLLMGRLKKGNKNTRMGHMSDPRKELFELLYFIVTKKSHWVMRTPDT
jgi:hypothetical protein